MKLPYFIESRLKKKFGQIYSEIQLSVSDQSGKIIRSHKQVCNSYNENLAAMLYRLFSQGNGNYLWTAPHVNATTAFDLLNTQRPLSFISFFGAIGGNNDDTCGLVIGTGNVAPSSMGRSLTAKIAQGIGAGQMIHQSQGSAAGVTVLGNVASFNLMRTFVNNSGGSITVNEMGLQTGDGSGFSFLILHDLLSPAQTVNNTQTLTLQLITQITT